MKTKTICKTLIIGLSFAVLGAVSFNIAKTGSTNAVIAQQEEVDTSDWTATINLKEKIGTYGASWPKYGWGAFNASSGSLVDATIQSNEFNTNMVDSTIEITKHNQDKAVGGVGRMQDWDTIIYNAKFTWQLNNYSRYISSINFPIGSTGGAQSNNSINLYTNRDASGEPVKNFKLGQDQAVTLYNTDSSINAVSFVDNPSDVNSWYGYSNFTYTVSYVTDPTQQAKFFSEAFLREMTCDGIGSITNDVWDTFNSRIGTMSAEALAVLKSAVANETSDSVIEQAMARYDLIANKYGKTNFLNRETVHSANRLGSIINDQNNALLIFLLIGSCVLVFCFIKMKTRVKR